MNNKYKFLNNKTFDIEYIDDVIPIENEMVDIISILNKKGYYTEMYSRAKLSSLLLISYLINNLIDKKLLNIDESNKDKIKEVINQNDYEATIIIFKEEYKFANLPKGFNLIGKDLYYNLSILKDTEEIKFKSLSELDEENKNSIKLLKEWVSSLDNNK